MEEIKIELALKVAIAAIYFNDRSDYIRALYSIVRHLTGREDVTYEDIAELFKKYNPC